MPAGEPLGGPVLPEGDSNPSYASTGVGSGMREASRVARSGAAGGRTQFRATCQANHRSRSASSSGMRSHMPEDGRTVASNFT